MAPRDPFDLEIRLEIEKLLKTKKTLREICAILNISLGQINRELFDYGWTRKTYNAREAHKRKEKMWEESTKRLAKKNSEIQKNLFIKRKTMEEENEILKMHIEILEERLKKGGTHEL
jgi:IS30 family transposase